VESHVAQSPPTIAGSTPSPSAPTPPTTEEIADHVARMGGGEAARALGQLDDAVAVQVLQRRNPGMVGDIIPHLDEE
jgi:hypothetical protein